MVNEGNTGRSVIRAPSPSLNSARRSAIVSLVLVLALAAALGIARLEKLVPVLALAFEPALGPVLELVLEPGPAPVLGQQQWHARGL